MYPAGEDDAELLPLLPGGDDGDSLCALAWPHMGQYIPAERFHRQAGQQLGFLQGRQIVFQRQFPFPRTQMYSHIDCHNGGEPGLRPSAEQAYRAQGHRAQPAVAVDADSRPGSAPKQRTFARPPARFFVFRLSAAFSWFACLRAPKAKGRSFLFRQPY